MKRLFSLSAILLLFAVPSAFCAVQEDPGGDALRSLAGFASGVAGFNRIFPQEKVYLQFDNTSYYVGETIWFKAFVTEASSHRRSPSGVLYVDLLSPSGELLKRQKLKITAGQADGSFPLMDGSTMYARELRGTVLSYPSGFYEVRAYTSYMLNFSEDIVFSRVLPVFEKPETEGKYYSGQPIIKNGTGQEIATESSRPRSVKQEADLNAGFYPESGNLVAGIPCRMAFRLTGPDGLPVTATGMLDGTVPVEVSHDGMGSVLFVPSRGRSEAVFEYGGKKFVFALPRAAASGHVMSTAVCGDSLSVTVRSVGMPSDTLGITLTCRGELKGFDILADSTECRSVKMSMADVPEGVCRVTLFDRNGTVYAARSVYHRRNGGTVTVSADYGEGRLSAFSPVTLGFELRDSYGNGVRDRFCLSVRDNRCPGTSVTDDLRTALLLSSDLRGCIFSPEYYFESDDSLHTAHLDLLMMVNGWERYDWKTMAGVEPFVETHRMEHGITLNGWVETAFTRKPMDGVTVLAAVTSWDRKNVELFRYETEENGYFGFDLADFYDNARLTISANPKRKKQIGTSARIRFDRSMLPSLRPYRPEEMVLAYPDADGVRDNLSGSPAAVEDVQETEIADNLPTLADISTGIMLPEVDIKGKRKFIDYYTFKAYDAKKDTEITLDKGDFSGDLGGYLLEKGYAVEFTEEGSIQAINGHGVFIYVHEPDRYIQFFGNYDMQDFQSVLVFDNVITKREAIDLSPLYKKWRQKHNPFDPEEIAAAERSRVVYVDILLKPEHMRPTRKELMNINSRVSTVDGYSAPYEFFSPQYPDGPLDGQADWRRTIYWNPNVVTDADGRASVSFFNNSYSRHIRVCCAGITAGGTPYVLDTSF